ncbi:pksN [Symbiodinium sp. CCMP2592]|nr:pksN [Symbiodinium sp. CCMP2592]CAE7277145.1 pksN [Symbiodinium sp. CCMP2592]
MRVRCVASSESTEEASVQVEDGVATETTIHARFGTAHLVPFLDRQPDRLESWRKLCEADKQPEQDVNQLYSSFTERGLSYGVSFQTLTSTACFTELGALARLQDPCKVECASWEKSLQLLHPAQLDGALLVELAARGEKSTYLPFAVRRTTIAAQCTSGDLWAAVRVQERSEASLLADVEIFNSDGQLAARLEGASC